MAGRDFDRLLRESVDATYPAYERERFTAHLRGLVRLWLDDTAAVER